MTGPIIRPGAREVRGECLPSKQEVVYRDEHGRHVGLAQGLAQVDLDGPAQGIEREIRGIGAEGVLDLVARAMLSARPTSVNGVAVSVVSNSS